MSLLNFDKIGCFAFLKIQIEFNKSTPNHPVPAMEILGCSRRLYSEMPVHLDLKWSAQLPVAPQRQNHAHFHHLALQMGRCVPT